MSSNINKKDKSGRTALFRAVWKDNVAECERLLDLGADPDMKSAPDDDEPPLYNATEYEILEMLIDCGATVNIQNAFG